MTDPCVTRNATMKRVNNETRGNIDIDEQDERSETRVFFFPIQPFHFQEAQGTLADVLRAFEIYRVLETLLCLFQVYSRYQVDVQCSWSVGLYSAISWPNIRQRSHRQFDIRFRKNDNSHYDCCRMLIAVQCHYFLFYIFGVLHELGGVIAEPETLISIGRLPHGKPRR
jgi:hypothetical protein